MKIVFFGTPDYVVPVLKSLDKNYEVVAVITQAPKPVGRKKIVTFSPVDEYAFKHKIPKFFSFAEFLKSGIEAHLGVLASYGEIISKEALDFFKFGIINLHPSLLPKYRGSSPVSTAIANGDKETGLTFIILDQKLDHGPVISSFKEEILDTDTGVSLRDRLFERGAEVLVDLIPAYIDKKIKLKEQNHDEATFTKKLTREDGFVEWKEIEKADITLFNKIRAYYPWPGVWSIKDGRRIKLLQSHLDENNKLVLDLVQYEGEKPEPFIIKS